jgi:hypothetical protein
MLIAALDRGFLERRVGRPHRVLLGLLRSAAREMPQRAFLTFQLLDSTSIARLRRGVNPRQRESIEQTLVRLTNGLENLSRDRIAYMGKASISPNKAKLLGSSDSTGLAINSPYLHAGLKKLALALPDRFSRPGMKTSSYVTGKYILMKVAESARLLPNEIIYQKKMSAVDAPIDEWYYGPLRGQVRLALAGLPFEPDSRFVDSLLQPKWAESLYRARFSTDNLTTHELSLLLSYARLVAFHKS